MHRPATPFVIRKQDEIQDAETGKLYNDKMELQILELKKLPKEMQAGEDIVKWMRFFNGKSRKEFEEMAQTDEYMGEAYEALKRLSADERKRLEYEAREKALRDYNCQINCAERRGEKRGEKRGIKLAVEVIRLHEQGMSNEDIALRCDVVVEKVREILAM